MAAHLPLGQGRLRPCPGAARLAYDFAQVPVTYALGRPVGGSARVSCIAFDAAGELIAAGTAGGRVGVQQVEQYMPSALRATSSALDADGRALCFRPSDETRPLIEFETQRALTALRWRPGLPNQFAAAASAPIGGGGGGSVVLIYDLASSCPRRPTRRCLADASQGLLHDILFCDVAASAHPGCTLVGGGRDGQLVVWDMRCDAPVLRPASTATSGFTLGKRSRDFGTGSVSALAHAQFGTAVCAGTSDGSLLVWDVRCLRSVVSCTRVNRGAASGVDSVLPHPRVGRVMVAQLSDGSVCVIDTEAGRVLASTALIPDQFPVTPEGLAAPPAPSSCPEYEPSVSLAALAGAPTLGHPWDGTPPAGEAADAPVGRPGFRYRGGRLAWALGDEWLCCAVPGDRAVAMLQVSRGCDRLEPMICTPTSSEVVCLSASPTGHFISLGLDDGALGMMAPLPNRREAASRAAAARATAAAAEAAAAASDAAEARALFDTSRTLLEPLLRGVGMQWETAVQALELSFGPTAHEAESGLAPPAAHADDVELFLEAIAADPSVLFSRLRTEERLGDASSGQGRVAGMLRRARIAALAEHEEATAAAQRRAERREIARQLELVERERRAAAGVGLNTEGGEDAAVTPAGEAPGAGTAAVQALVAEVPSAGVHVAEARAARAAAEAGADKPTVQAVRSGALNAGVEGTSAGSVPTGAAGESTAAGSMAGEGGSAGAMPPVHPGASAGSVGYMRGEQTGEGAGRRSPLLESGRGNRLVDSSGHALPPAGPKRGRSEASHGKTSRSSGHSRKAPGGAASSVCATDGSSGEQASLLSGGRTGGRTVECNPPTAPDQAKLPLKQASLARFFAPA